MVCALLFCYVWFAPFGRHKADNKEPLESEDLFPVPDSVAYIHEGIAKTLSKEQKDAIYNSFISLLETEDFYIDGYLGSMGREEFLQNVLTKENLELRYEQRRSFTGVFRGTSPFFDNDAAAIGGRLLEFDAILISISDDWQLTIVLYKDGKYNFSNEYWFFKGTREGSFRDFEKQVKELA